MFEMRPKTAIGCDIENVSRFRSVLNNRDFVSRVFTAGEIEHLCKTESPELEMARKFACKESVFKAFSVLRRKVTMDLIEISSGDNCEMTARALDEGIDRMYAIHVSVTGADDLVLASAVVNRR